MIRTQIYLTDQQRNELAILSEIQGKKQGCGSFTNNYLPYNSRLLEEYNE